MVELVTGELDPRQSREVRNLFAGNRWHEGSNGLQCG
jgi:hypothetical protein